MYFVLLEAESAGLMENIENIFNVFSFMFSGVSVAGLYLQTSPQAKQRLITH